MEDKKEWDCCVTGTGISQLISKDRNNCQFPRRSAWSVGQHVTTSRWTLDACPIPGEVTKMAYLGFI